MKNILPYLSVFLCSTLLAQTNNQETHQHNIKRIEGSIRVDGVLDDSQWTDIEPVGQFTYSFPVEYQLVEEPYQTEVKIAYNDKFIYVSAKCYGDSDKIVIPTLKRDNGLIWTGDVFMVSFDAVNERTNGFAFGTNPAGVQIDSQFDANTGTRGGGGSNRFNIAWDSKWVVNWK